MPDSEQPDGWRIARLGDVAAVETGGTPSRNKPEFWGGEVRWMSSGEVNRRHVTTTAETITQAGVASSNAKVFPPGTIMLALNGQGKTRGKVAMLEVEAACNQSLAAIRGRGWVDSRFLLHNLDSRYYELRALTGDDARNGLNLGLLRSLRVMLPPLGEQAGIAGVLDSIDAAIAKTEAVIEATERLRSALLHELLTRGVPGWHSEWKQVPGIGTIPACWDVMKGDSLFKLEGGYGPADLQFNEDGPAMFLKVDDLNEADPGVARWIDKSKLNWWPRRNPTVRRLPEGTLVLPKRGEAIFHSRVLITRREAAIDPNLMAIRPNQADDAEFLRYLMLATGLHRLCDNSGIPQINNKHLYPRKFQWPRRPERGQITRLLAAVEDRLMAECSQLSEVVALKRSIAGALLSGRMRVPSAPGEA